MIEQYEPGRVGAMVARRFQGRVSNSYSTTCARRGTLITNLLIGHEREVESMVMCNG